MKDVLQYATTNNAIMKQVVEIDWIDSECLEIEIRIIPRKKI